MSRSSVIRRVVRIQVVGLVVQREEEEVRRGAAGRALSGAVHVGHAIRTKTLCPIIEAAGLGGINQLQGRSDVVCCHALLVEVDGDIGNERLPTELKEKRRVVERPGRGIDNVPADAAVFALRIRRLPEFEEVVLAGEALPAFRQHPRRVDAACRKWR